MSIYTAVICVHLFVRTYKYVSKDHNRPFKHVRSTHNET